MKKYSLALWWWGAAWLAHIWIIQQIQQKNIQIWEIAGTSMWAIIWAWLAFGIWKNEMIKILKETNFLKLIDLNLKTWIVIWNKVKQRLTEIFGDLQIQDAEIPLKIIATQLKDGKTKVFKKWSVVDAIMASICLPGIFKPYEIDWNFYLDWWLKANLPILELENKDIIAVSVIIRWKNWMISEKTTFLNFQIKKSFWYYNYEILNKSLYIILQNNEYLSIQLAKEKWKNITLLTPDLSEYKIYDFLKFEKIIQIGENYKR